MVCGLRERKTWFCVCVFFCMCVSECVLVHILQLRGIHTVLVEQTWIPMMLFDWPSSPQGPRVNAQLSPLQLSQIALPCQIRERMSNTWGGDCVMCPERVFVFVVRAWGIVRIERPRGFSCYWHRALLSQNNSCSTPCGIGMRALMVLIALQLVLVGWCPHVL